ncbi:hypothetical protein ABZP36_033852 [Zizania latifolia]
MASSRSWLLLVSCLTVAATAGVLQTRAQPDSNGFISIDCGLSGKTAYVDNTTKLSYFPDAGFIDVGMNHNISAEYISVGSSRLFDNVRSFPGGARRSCYTLRSLVLGLKYLVRANFKYGNYDGLGRPPAFDLYAGVNFWMTVNISDPGASLTAEAIVVVPEESMQVCLLNTGGGTPFISSLDLRPLKNSLYPQANATQGLVMVARVNFGPTDTFIRYPDDPRDRVWGPWIDTTLYKEISTTKIVQNVEKDMFEAPSAVMQTAITPRSASGSIELLWTDEPNIPSLGYITIFHFSELQLLQANTTRSFNIYINNVFVGDMTPDYLYADASYDTKPYHGSNKYNISLRATATSTLPPIINALEIFAVIPTTNVPTDAQDVSAITAIKKLYQVKENWMGDPCVPKTLAWDWLSCSYAISSPPTITGVNLSFNGLNGGISSSFTDLKSVQYLNLSNNLLTGSIPEDLSQLSSLTVLDLTGNQLSGSIPSGLLKRAQDKSLDLRYYNNLCIYEAGCPPPDDGKSKLSIYISVPIVVVVTVILALVSFCLLRRKSKGSANNTINLDETTRHVNLDETASHVERNDGDGSLFAGGDRNGRYLTWIERLQIALESAQGLEYLHKGCSPPLIHRDVKATNILLNMKLEAKIADFGLSKAFKRDNDTHVSTSMLVGTPGYLDPEYHATLNLTTKSDVYGFGVVLLELVTGKPPILRALEPITIIQWTQQGLALGNIEGVVDARMKGIYDINSLWKVAETALKCTMQISAQRPSMTDVVAQLQECLDLELGRAHNSNDHVTQTRPTHEMEQLEGVPLPSGPAAR